MSTFRWRLVIHGGVDGYSHLPVYLRCIVTITDLKQFWTALFKQFKHMGYPHELGQTEEERMLAFLCLCLTIHSVGRDVALCWLEEVYTISALNAYGVTCIMVLPNSTMTCFCTSSPLTYLTHSMTSICSAYTLYIFLASMFTFNSGSPHGFTIHYVQLGTTPPCNFGLRVCWCNSMMSTKWTMKITRCNFACWLTFFLLL